MAQGSYCLGLFPCGQRLEIFVIPAVKGFVGFLPSAASPSPAPWGVVRERCGEQKGHLLPPMAQLVLSEIRGRGIWPLPECPGAPSSAEGRRTGGGGSPHSRGKREGLPAMGVWGSLQLPRLLGQSQDFTVDVTRENAASGIALAAR